MANITHKNLYFRLALIATLLGFCVIMLGAYTRLKDAGLGCPDWPGCYGQFLVPHNQAEILEAKQLYPAEPIQTNKAWAEMIHRYFAGILGFIILGLALWAIARRRNDIEQPMLLPLLLMIIVIFQAALGMWTVTWKLLPLIVMGHLLGGMTIVALLWSLTLKTGKLFPNQTAPITQLRPWAIIGLSIVALQIMLGGWTTANYASLACTSFPFCQGNLFPLQEMQRAFNIFSPIGANYEGGVLDMAARVTIQMFHRYGAILITIYVGILSLFLVRKSSGLRGLGWVLLGLLLLQIGLGIMNITYLLPIVIAIAHNLVAALLLLAMVTLVYKLFSESQDPV